MSEPWDIDDAIKRGKENRHFPTWAGARVDPTFQDHFCKRCLQPTRRYQMSLDGANNEEVVKDDLCSRCLSAVLSRTSVGCDEQNLK